MQKAGTPQLTRPTLTAHPLIVAYVLHLKAIRTYAQDFALRLIVFPVQLLLAVLLWTAVIDTGKSELSFRYIVGYYAVLLAFTRLIPFGAVAMRVSSDIGRGTLAVVLARPVRAWWLPLSELLATATVALVFTAPLFVGMLIWQGTSLERVILSLALFIIGAMLQFWFYFLIGSIAFWTEEVRGIMQGVNLALTLLTGALVPLSYLPANAQAFLQLTPFYYFVYLPLEVLLEPNKPLEIRVFIILGIWTVLLPLAALQIFRSGLERFTANGV